MLGEVTMVQLYSVALTAGKAHKDHKHHHVHHFDHNGQAITTTPPPTPAPRPNQPTHPLLTSGQINPNIKINLANPPPPEPMMVPGQLPNGQEFNAQLVNGQFIGNLVSQQLLGTVPQQPQPIAQQGLNFGLHSGLQSGPQSGVQSFQRSLPNFQGAGIAQSFVKSSQHGQSFSTSHTGSGLVHPSLVNPANVQFIDATVSDHQLFKRNNEEESKKVVKRQVEGHADRREFILAGDTIIDDGLGFGQEYLSGLATFVGNQPIIKQQQQSDEREPAEAEVMAVMKICGGCDEEPFSKALVFGWRTVPKKLYSGAIYSPAVPQCRVF